MNKTVEVWLDADLTFAPTLIGTLQSDNGQTRFDYHRTWLDHVQAFAIDPHLPLSRGSFFPAPDAENFGVFLDSSPDRWGQMLMKRREALDAKDQGRKPRNLYSWDFLLGVQDLTRQGALRFRSSDSAQYLDSHKLAAPPVTSLGELANVALALSNKQLDDMAPLHRWLSVLVAPGASLGGARPKANFTEADGSLWIAKFPASDDERDVGAWEGITHTLALAAGVNVPAAKTVRLANKHHTFCVQRFDRNAGRRVFYASAMTMLQKPSSEGASYLELAEFLSRNGDPQTLRSDLAQLFRRIVFNVAVGNRDDHLRNHGFLLSRGGWRLAPAFDVNPNVDKADHVLNLDDVDNRPDIATVLATADFYGLSESEASTVLREVAAATSRWQSAARGVGLNGAEIDGVASAFSALDDWPP